MYGTTLRPTEPPCQGPSAPLNTALRLPGFSWVFVLEVALPVPLPEAVVKDLVSSTAGVEGVVIHPT